MDIIPLEFDYKGKHYKGYFSAVHGAGGNTFFLTIDQFHRGQLFYTQNHGWRFTNNKNEFTELADYFGKVVTR